MEKKTLPSQMRIPTATSMFGMATVRKSIDPQFEQWAVIFPDRPTEWYGSLFEAEKVASRFNNGRR